MPPIDPRFRPTLPPIRGYPTSYPVGYPGTLPGSPFPNKNGGPFNLEPPPIGEARAMVTSDAQAVPSSQMSPDSLTPQVSVNDLTAAWLQNNLLFGRARRLPMLGFKYNLHTTTVYGIVPFNGTGNVSFTPGVDPSAFGGVQFNNDAIVTRIELTISVRSNTNNGYIGAFILSNPQDAGTSFDFTGAKNIILSNVTNLETAVISKNFAFGAYSGYFFRGGERIGLGVTGDNTGICLVNLNYHWIEATGQVVKNG